MADKKISQLTAADALTGVEEAPFVQGGATKKATPEQIRAYVESQPNVFGVTQTIEDAAPALRFSENDTVDKNWEFIGVAGALRLDELSDAFSTTGTHHTFTHGGGTQFGAPTGGDQGAGTVNAEGLFENGTGVAKLSGGADANFTAMPQVGGDPIVESGSNADGEFTRWADGTQHCLRLYSPSFSISGGAGSLFVSSDMTWNFPQSFTGPEAPSPDSGIRIAIQAINARGDRAWWGAGRDPDGGGASATWRALDVVSRTSQDQRVFLFATGRWK